MNLYEFLLALEWQHWLLMVILGCLTVAGINALGPFIEHNTVTYLGCGTGEEEDEEEKES